MRPRFADEDVEKEYETSIIARPTKGCDSAQSNGGKDGHTGSVKEGKQVYIYPPKGEDPSPMYQGLRTNLPHVRSALPAPRLAFRSRLLIIAGSDGF